MRASGAIERLDADVRASEIEMRGAGARHGVEATAHGERSCPPSRRLHIVELLAKSCPAANHHIRRALTAPLTARLRHDATRKVHLVALRCLPNRHDSWRALDDVKHGVALTIECQQTHPSLSGREQHLASIQREGGGVTRFQQLGQFEATAIIC
ncbi:hypothetical protein FGB62_84g12 [Gracilaria domingensis]|nr:hypothetical protein FGB62_84g12 [Gracilaria domingensis]